MNREALMAVARAAMPASRAQAAPSATPPSAMLPAVRDDLAEQVERFLAGAPRAARRLIGAVLAAVEWSAVLFCGARLSKLDARRAEEHIARWAHGPLRLAFRALVSPLKLVHFADPRVARAIGYDPPAETACAHPAPAPLPALASLGEPGARDSETGERGRRAMEQDEPGQAPLPALASLDGALPLSHSGKGGRGDWGGERRRRGNQLEPSRRARCEVAVIGTGAGGGPVAKELAELGRDVAILEEGAHVPTSRFNRRPLEMAALLYRDLGMTLALGGGAAIPVPLGRAVGGTTLINSGTCFRAPKHIFQSWDFDPRLDEDYAYVEELIEVAEVPEHLLGGCARVVQRGAAKLGLHGAPLKRNARHCQGSGVCCFGCPTEAKRSSNVSWIPAAQRAGARLYTNCKVDRIELGQSTHLVHTATGVIEADAVVVCAGTLATPQLLRKSGLRHEALGRNISLHPACKASALFDEEIRGWEGVPQGYGIHDLAEEGILFEGIFTPPEFGAFALPFVGPRLTEVMERYAHLASFGLMIEDRSIGSISSSGQLFYAPGAPELEKLQKGIELLIELFFAAGATQVFAPVEGFTDLRAPAKLPKLRPSMLELSAFHPLGSCRASPDPLRGVLDAELEAHDAQRLFVADGSVFPSSLGVNPQLTIMAMARRCARHVHARLQGSPRA